MQLRSYIRLRCVVFFGCYSTSGGALGITSIVDRILVFRDGEIVEDGSHRELLTQGGYYSELYHSQARWYAKESTKQ